MSGPVRTARRIRWALAIPVVVAAGLVTEDTKANYRNLAITDTN